MKRCLLAVTALLLLQSLTAQKKYAHTLLWRISGNNLKGPSYLYGTMHMKQKKLFYFGDSVYSAIERSDGFAMEIDPHKMMDSLFADLTTDDTSKLLKDAYSKEEFEKNASKLEKRFGKPADKITLRQLKREQREAAYDIKRKDDMRTAMDLYLFGIADRLDKWTGGIEDYRDQVNTLDELGKDIKIDDIFKEDNRAKKELSTMTDIYLREDLDDIIKFMSSNDPDYNDILINERNKKMAVRIDSLARIRPTFFAVGAAHLPDSTGLIDLLIKKGFTVEPVFSSTRIPPDKYTYPENKKRWIEIREKEYSAEMPVKPWPFVMGEDSMMKAKISFDLIAFTFFMTGVVHNPAAVPNSSPAGTDSILRNMIRSMAKKGFKGSEKNILSGDKRGLEVFGTSSEKLFYRLQVFADSGYYFFVMAGTETEENVRNKETEKFFSSFRINSFDHGYKASEPMTGIFRDEQKAFEIAFASKPIIKKQKNEDSSTITMEYSCLDLKHLCYSEVMVRDMAPGYYMSLSDREYFNNLIETYKANPTLQIIDSGFTTLQGLKSMRLILQYSEGTGEVEVVVNFVNKGNRAFIILLSGDKGLSETAYAKEFFGSFRILESKTDNWHNQSNTGYGFGTWLPGLLRPTKDSTKEKQILISYDSNSSNTYHVEKLAIPKYKWYINDSSLWEDELSGVISLYDSSFHYDIIRNGKGVSFYDPSRKGEVIQKEYILLNGDTLYYLYSNISKADSANATYDKFFSELRFNKEFPSTIFNNKSSLILADLASNDSTGIEEAASYLSYVDFAGADIGAVKKALLRVYPASTENSFYSVNERILNNIPDSIMPRFNAMLRDNYDSISPEEESIRYQWLSCMAKLRTKESYNEVLKKWLQKVPTKGYPMSLVYELKDSLSLCTTFYPGILELADDSIAYSGVLDLTNEMLDSNLINPSVLIPYHERIYKLTRKRILDIKADSNEVSYHDKIIIGVLQKINSAESRSLIRDYLQLSPSYIKEVAALALLALNEKVPAEVLTQLASDPYYRTSLYEKLKQLHMLPLFPARYKTQPAFAESFIHEAITEELDDEEFSVSAIGERTIKINGKKKKVFLFKVSAGYDGEEKKDYLSVCGPYDMNKDSVESDHSYYMTDYDEEFLPMKLEEHFRRIISEIEKLNKEEAASSFTNG